MSTLSILTFLYKRDLTRERNDRKSASNYTLRSVAKSRGVFGGEPPSVSNLPCNVKYS